MKILLLGASGQLGQEWQLWADQIEENITLIPYTSTQLDVTSHNEVKEEVYQQQPDLVINCAAYTDVDGAEEHRDLARKVNKEAVAHLAELSAEINFKLVHYSTDYIFPGNKEDRHEFPDGYPEEYPARPVNYYGQTKWEGEEAIREQTQNHLIVRISWLCGQFGDNFVTKMLTLGQEKKKLKVVNDQWGSPTFADNVVENTWMLFKSGEKGTYHITTKGMITWYDFATEIFDQSGIDVDIEAVSSESFPRKAKRPFFSKLNTKKAQAVQETNIIGWREGLQQLFYSLNR